MKTPKVNEQEIQAFWTKRPMIHPGYGFDPSKASPEDVFEHVERIVRDKGRLFQNEGEPLLSRFIDYGQLRDSCVLDIGYGVGWLVRELRQAGAIVHGIDLSESHFEYASYRFREDPNVHLQIASAEKIPFPDCTFDFISAYGVIHHSADDQQCYDEIWRVLKPGGRVFLMLYRRGGPKYWWQKMFRKGILQGGLFRHGFHIQRFINSVTDAYQQDSPGAPISRHYSRREINEKLKRFFEVDLKISGNENEWRDLPFGRFPVSNLLGARMLHRLVGLSGAYWMVRLVK